MAKRWRTIRSAITTALLLVLQGAILFGALPYAAAGRKAAWLLFLLLDGAALGLVCAFPAARRRFEGENGLNYLDAASLLLLLNTAVMCYHQNSILQGRFPYTELAGVSALAAMPLPMLWMRERCGCQREGSRRFYLAWAGAEALALVLFPLFGLERPAGAVYISAAFLLCAFLLEGVCQSLGKRLPGEKPGRDAAVERTDELTGLLGRAAFAARLKELLETTAPEKLHAVLMIDIDGFKAVNDTFGHDFGDQVLRQIADDLRNIQRGDDLVARLGGDEFILCLKNVPSERKFITHRCNQLLQALGKSFGDEVAVSASIGVAFYPRHGRDFGTLYRHADRAMYQAKDAGRDCFVIYGEGPGRAEAEPPDGLPPQDAPGSEGEQDRRYTLLVADDQPLNRGMLAEIFREDYQVLEAAGGRETLEILRREREKVSVLLLDLLMPEVSGLDVLRAMREDDSLQSIPVVVVSGAGEREYSAMVIDLGATDFVAKPVDRTLIRLRVRNAIARRESERLRTQNRELLVQRASEARHQKQLRYVADHDPVTHIYNKSAFYRRTRAMLNEHPDTEYCILCFDILRFRAVNDIFGHDEGDRLLRYIAGQLRNLVGESGACARVSVDLFAACMPYNGRQVFTAMEQMSGSLRGYDLSFEVQLWYGIYRIDDRSLPINQMQDRAVMAERSVKGSYVANYAFYDDSMSAKLLLEQSMINEMNAALLGGQFVVYYQTKCRLDTGKIVGAEALVRWQHPRRGLLGPGEFVPLFERNGFIMRLDIYMWEQVCAFLGERLKKDPEDRLRVSVNISRANLYNPNLCATLDGLCARYGVPRSCMDVEITESAYVENAQLLLDLTDQLHRLGFTVEMDDFGSGYSSLNMLKEIPVDVLKLDMRFLYGIQKDPRGGSILSSIVSMAEKLQMEVIAEGVETEEQARFLAAIGCRQAQGFYYDRPMPQELFRQRLLEEKRADQPARDLETARRQLGQLLCSAAMARRRGKRLEVLQANEYYYRLMQISEENFDQGDRWADSRIDSTDLKRIFQAMEEARAAGSPRQCDYVQLDMQNRYHLMAATVQFVTDTPEGPVYIAQLVEQPRAVQTVV